LVFHAAARHEPQFRIDVLRETCQGGFVTASPSSQELCDFYRARVDRSPVLPWHQQIYDKRGRIWGAIADCTGGGRTKSHHDLLQKAGETNETTDNDRAAGESRH